MSAHNSVNGDWCGQNRPLLTEILRGEWDFQGFVISDWIFGLRDAATSLTAGLDVEMPYRMVRAQHLPAALERGDASWDDVDRSVRRIVATLLRFDDVLSAPSPPREVIGSAEHRALAQEVAARSVVLLRNEPVDGTPVLPLPAEARVAVLGRLADTVNLGDGGSSDVWDLDCHTVLDGLRAAMAEVVHDDGSDPDRAAAVAASTDAAVVVVGYTYLDEGEFIGEAGVGALAEMFPPADESEVVERFRAALAERPSTTRPERLASRPRGLVVGGDRGSLRLLDADVELVRAVAAANPRTIVAIQAGSAVVMSEWIDAVAAVVQAWYGGCRAGPGLADVLLGVVNPSARLPFTVPLDEGDLPPFERHAASFRYDRWHGWWHLARHGRAPAFPFGFGLSYTTFTLGDIHVSTDGDAIAVHGVARNTGDRDGADVVQVYAQLPDREAPDRLVGFTRVAVPAGQHARFGVRIPADRLATRDPDAHAWRPPTGRHLITVARHAGDPAGVTVEIDL
jgi:beta-glucosidase